MEASEHTLFLSYHVLYFGCLILLTLLLNASHQCPSFSFSWPPALPSQPLVLHSSSTTYVACAVVPHCHCCCLFCTHLCLAIVFSFI
ncbi:hypothetical protein EDB19DRAFT_1675941 [Suillus lakei]|nr:hypothetical protein EDB19DRAFT_1675941 [Suillus lakei]